MYVIEHMITLYQKKKRNLAVQESPLPLCIVRCNEYTLCTQTNNVSSFTIRSCKETLESTKQAH